MAWIESHQGLAAHWKTRRLARILGLKIPTVIGHLHLFWWWAMDYADNGSLRGYTAQDLADAAQWEGVPEEWVSGLVECGQGRSAGFLEVIDGDLVIHDWEDYIGRLLERREANKERAKKSKVARRLRATNAQPDEGCAQPDESCAQGAQELRDGCAKVAPLPNHDRTVPNLTVQNQENDHVPPAGETPPPEKPAPAFHDDADRLATLLADLIEGNGSKRPRVTDSWRQEIDRMIRLDNRTPANIEAAIKWCQASEFWRGNIMSPAKLREKYDTLRLQAQRDAQAQGAKPGDVQSEIAKFIAQRGGQA